ncbi:MAG TPA: HAD family hydrolase [Kofleriaceae bacterium]
MIVYLFDIDGTLLHAHGSGRGAFDDVFAAHHGVAAASEGVRYGGKTDPALVDEIFAARLGRPPSAAERAAFLDAYVPRLRARLAASAARVIEGVAEALAFLATRTDVRLGVATGNIREGADAKLASAGLGRWFQFGGYGSDSALRAELVAHAIARAGVQPREVIVIGDTIHDIAAARACSATVCAVATGTDPADRLGHADAVFTSLAELPAWHATRFG